MLSFLWNVCRTVVRQSQKFRVILDILEDGTAGVAIPGCRCEGKVFLNVGQYYAKRELYHADGRVKVSRRETLVPTADTREQVKIRERT